MDCSSKGLEHISAPINRFLAKELDKIIENVGAETAIRDYINSVLESREAPQEFLEYLEVAKTFLVSGIYKE